MEYESYNKVMSNEESKAEEFRAGYMDENNHTFDTQKESVPHSSFSSMKKDTDYPSKKPISFSCDSKERRNVNKCITRFMFKHYDKDDIKKYYAKYNFVLDNGSREVLKEVKQHERCRETGEDTEAGKKDYKKLLRMLMCYKSLRTIMKCSLEYLHDRLSNRECSGIKHNNNIVYTQTVKDYIHYIDKIESDLNASAK